MTKTGIVIIKVDGFVLEAALGVKVGDAQHMIVTGWTASAGIFGDYVARKQQAEREDSDLAVVMACYDMPHADAWNYASEARASVGSQRAREAALRGQPYMLPWRGPSTSSGPA